MKKTIAAIAVALSLALGSCGMFGGSDNGNGTNGSGSNGSNGNGANGGVESMAGEMQGMIESEGDKMFEGGEVSDKADHTDDMFRGGQVSDRPGDMNIARERTPLMR